MVPTVVSPATMDIGPVAGSVVLTVMVMEAFV